MGTDFMLDGGNWSNARASGYKHRTLVRDALQLRMNAYRVLMTRARDATVVFVPPLPELDETFGYLVALGFRALETHPRALLG